MGLRYVYLLFLHSLLRFYNIALPNFGHSVTTIMEHSEPYIIHILNLYSTFTLQIASIFDDHVYNVKSEANNHYSCFQNRKLRMTDAIYSCERVSKDSEYFLASFLL